MNKRKDTTKDSTMDAMKKPMPRMDFKTLKRDRKSVV